MAIKETYKIKTSNNDEYIITGQTGVFKQEDFNNRNQKFLISEDKSKRFIFIDLWQLGVFGSENCNQTYDKNEGLNIITEKDIIKYTKDIIKYINNGLFNEIKQAIIDEIKADEEETTKLIR